MLSHIFILIMSKLAAYLKKLEPASAEIHYFIHNGGLV